MDRRQAQNSSSSGKGKAVHLLLIRHADALPLGDVPSSSDADRPLSVRGHAQAKALGRLLNKRQIRLDRIVASPLLRARETADDLRAALSADAPAVTLNEELAPGGKRRKLARSLRELGGDCLGIVGHEPDLSILVAWLIGSKKAQIDLAKGGVASINFSDAVRKDAGVLVWLLTPDLIEDGTTSPPVA
jgi:phosphohistidine phosphatase